MDNVKDGLLRLEVLDLSNDPLPYLGEEVEKVGEVRLAGGRVDNCLKWDAEEGEAEYKNKDPKDEIQHPPYYTTR